MKNSGVTEYVCYDGGTRCGTFWPISYSFRPTEHSTRDLPLTLTVRCTVSAVVQLCRTVIMFWGLLLGRESLSALVHTLSQTQFWVLLQELRYWGIGVLRY